MGDTQSSTHFKRLEHLRLQSWTPLSVKRFFAATNGTFLIFHANS